MFANDPISANVKEKCEPVQAGHVQVGDFLPYGTNKYVVTDIQIKADVAFRYHYIMRLMGASPSGDIIGEDSRMTWADAAFDAKLWRFKKTLDPKRRKR